MVKPIKAKRYQHHSNNLELYYSHGRFSIGAQAETIVMAPLIIPAAPKPATARPTINMVEETAAPQSTDPSSKIAKKTKNDH